MTKIKDLPKHEMPREKLIEKGVEALKNSELLAILLGTGIKGKNVIELSEGILNKYPMKKLLSLDFKIISKVKGIGPAKACHFLASFEFAKRALGVEDDSLPIISSIKDIVAQLQELRTAKKEHFVVLYLNARDQLIKKETISIGILNASLVHPREVFKPAIDCLAASIVLAHNHPSGGVEPSEEDLSLNKRLLDVGKMVGIEVVDHIIISKDKYKSIML